MHGSGDDFGHRPQPAVVNGIPLWECRGCGDQWLSRGFPHRYCPEARCRSCRRPIGFVEGVGWLHRALPQHAAAPVTCDDAQPAGRDPPRSARAEW